MIYVDDYHEDNMALANLFKRYKVDAMFAIDLVDPDAELQIRLLDQMGFKIASHTVTHAHLSRVSPEQAYWELKHSKEFLEELIKKEVDMIVYPRGRYNEGVIKMAKEIGYKYGRTTKLYENGDMEKAGVHLSYPRTEYGFTDPFDFAEKSELKDQWLHCFELNKFNLWEKLEKFISQGKNA